PGLVGVVLVPGGGRRGVEPVGSARQAEDLEGAVGPRTRRDPAPGFLLLGEGEDVDVRERLALLALHAPADREPRGEDELEVVALVALLHEEAQARALRAAGLAGGERVVARRDAAEPEAPVRVARGMA